MTKVEKVREFKRVIEAWVPGGDDPFNLRSVYENDQHELRKVWAAYRNGDMKEAYRLAWRLDSIVRDEIPEFVWMDLEAAEPNKI